jgi:hypothetical protein
MPYSLFGIAAIASTIHSGIPKERSITKDYSALYRSWMHHGGLRSNPIREQSKDELPEWHFDRTGWIW